MSSSSSSSSSSQYTVHAVYLFGLCFLSVQRRGVGDVGGLNLISGEKALSILYVLKYGESCVKVFVCTCKDDGDDDSDIVFVCTCKDAKIC